MVAFDNIKGVAFDLDGVIADTAKFHTMAWRQLAENLGVAWNSQLQENLKGLGRMDSLNMILETGDIVDKYSDVEKETLATSKNDAYKELIATLTPDDILPGMKNFLDELQRNGYLMSVASASKNAPFILERLGLTSYFVGVVNPSKLHAGKPDPEIFMRAAEILNLNPHNVMSLEDSEAGIQSIRGAHELAIGIGVTGEVTFTSTREISLAAIKENLEYEV